MRIYEKYKDSGISWIGEIPEGWEKKRLKYVSSCNDEILPETTNPNKQIEYVEIGDVVNGMGIVNSTIYPFAKAPSRARRITQKGDIIISTVRTYLKAIAKVNKNGLIVSTGFAVIRPQKVNSSLLAYILQSPYFVDRVMSKSVGVSYPAINASQISNIEIAIPTYAEQEAIANYLDKKTAEIDKIIAEREKKIELLNELKSSIISRAVTKGINPHAKMKDSGIDWIGEIPEDWEICKFKYTINIRNGKDYKDVQSDNHNDYPVYGSGGVFAYAKKYLYNGEALLLGRKGTIDKPIYIQKKKFWTVDTMFYGLAIKGNVCKYLYYQALTFPYGRYATSTALPSMTQSDLGNNPICLPSILEQQAIANYLDKKTEEIDKTISAIKNECNLYKEYKQSLISEVVTGKRKVID